jgi:peptidyl-tRNA hydrolase
MNKLYVIVRNDLEPPGLQGAQMVHAAKLFGVEHPREDVDWYENSNNVVLLQVPSKEELVELAYKATCAGLPVSIFREPDVNDEPTAIALLGRGAKRLVSSLPLALRAA